MSAPTVAERVAAGAAWLDQHEPGWWQRINLDRLNLNSECNCILGQLHGRYNDAPAVGAAALNGDGGSHYAILRWALPLGFALDWDDCRTDGRELTAAWRDLISARRAAGGAA